MQKPRDPYADPTVLESAYKAWVEAERPQCGKFNGVLHETLLNMDKGVQAIKGIVAPWSEASKPTNPKDAVGIRKVPFSVIPLPVLAELGLAMLEGARKYGRHNYRAAGVRASVYVDAVLRHVSLFWEGEDIDPDSRLSHVTKAIASLTVLRDSMIRGNWVDDRPPRVKDGWLKELNVKAGQIIDDYPDAKDAFTEAQNDPFYDPRTGRRAGDPGAG